MSYELSMPEIARREGNFFNGVMPSAIDGKMYYVELQWLAEDIKNVVIKLQGVDSEENMLRLIFSRVYDFVIAHNSITNNANYGIFDDSKGIYDDAFEACFFMSLCMFLYDTRRIGGISLRKFIYKHSPRKYNVKGSPNYFDFDNKPREFCESNSDKSENSSDLILDNEAMLRQYRKRLLDKRPVYQHSSEWSAIRKVSEHEWELYFLGDEDILVDTRMDKGTKDQTRERSARERKFKDTLKRIRNLYNGLYRAFESPIDAGYIDRLETEYDKFLNKLKKIKYNDYLELNRFILEHIRKDIHCYGINFYRFEKELGLHKVTSEMKRMLNCKSEDEEDAALKRFILLDKIPFPKLYEAFYSLEGERSTAVYAETFCSFMDDLAHSYRLIIDEFIEEGLLGKNWENLLLEAVNKLAETVLYNPEEIDYTVTPECQERFMKVIANPVYMKVMRQINAVDNLQTAFSGVDDDI